jgi:hypothetical protein
MATVFASNASKRMERKSRMESERHSIPTWLERDKNPEPKWVINKMKEYGIYRKGKMTYANYSLIYDAFIELVMSHAVSTIPKENEND